MTICLHRSPMFVYYGLYLSRLFLVKCLSCSYCLHKRTATSHCVYSLNSYLVCQCFSIALVFSNLSNLYRTPYRLRHWIGRNNKIPVYFLYSTGNRQKSLLYVLRSLSEFLAFVWQQIHHYHKHCENMSPYFYYLLFHPYRTGLRRTSYIVPSYWRFLHQKTFLSVSNSC